MAESAQSIYENTIDLMRYLDDDQLLAIRAIVIELSAVRIPWKSPLGITNDKQLFAHIDHSLAQAKEGIGRDADEVADGLLQEYAL